jgi:organic radical activating enzyme
MALTQSFQEQGHFVQIETNGEYLTSIYKDRVWVTLSPKEEKNIQKASFAHEVKWLVGDGEELWKHKLKDGAIGQGIPHFLQPVTGDSGIHGVEYERNLKETLRLVKLHPHTFRLGVQLHKYLRIK